MNIAKDINLKHHFQLECISECAAMKPVYRLIILSILSFGSICHAYEMGHSQITFIRDESGPREILTEIYYPAELAGENVPVAESMDQTGFPVIAFAHGFLMVWSAYENIWADLVPKGYILCLPRTEGSLAPNHLEFARDLNHILAEMLMAGDDPESMFFEKIHPATAVMGHSMGGGASLLAAAENTGITSVINLAAAETMPSAIEAAGSISCPTLLIAGSDDCITPPEIHQIPMYDALNADCRLLINLDGGSHCQFAEDNFTCSLGELFCSPPGITQATQHLLISLFIGPWLDYHLKGITPALTEIEALLSMLSDDFSVLEDCLDVEDNPDPIFGDGNLDGELDVLDVVLLVNLILYDNPINAVQSYMQDLNMDGNTDVLDIVLLVDLILLGD